MTHASLAFKPGTKNLTEEQVSEIIELVRTIIAEEDLTTLISELEDQVIELSTKVHETTEETTQRLNDLEKEIYE